MVSRRVIVIFGPPGAGKTTLAHTLGLPVYDRDDPEWHGSESRFRAALRALAHRRDAQAAVIRTGATRKARAQAIAMCGATDTMLLDTPADVCATRVRDRGRGDIASQIRGIRQWHETYEPDPEAAHGATSRRW